MDELINIISNFGFPIALTIYLMVRFEKKIDDLDKSISGDSGLIVQIKDLGGKIDELKECVKEIK